MNKTFDKFISGKHRCAIYPALLVFKCISLVIEESCLFCILADGI